MPGGLVSGNTARSDAIVIRGDPGGLRWLAGEAGQTSVVNDVVSELAAIGRLPPEELAAAGQSNMARLVGDDPSLRRWLTDLRA